MMPTSFRNGLPDATDHHLMAQPSDRSIGENHGFWFFEKGEEFFFHVHLESSPDLWSARCEMVHALFANGDTFSDWQFGLDTTENGPGSASTQTTCIQPFAHWQLDYQGMPYLSNGYELAERYSDLITCARHPISVNLTMHMAVIPWVAGRLNGGMNDAAQAAIGGFRYEQLFTAEAQLKTKAGDKILRGSGLRTRRIGQRNTLLWLATAGWWQSSPTVKASGCKGILRRMAT